VRERDRERDRERQRQRDRQRQRQRQRQTETDRERKVGYERVKRSIDKKYCTFGDRRGRVRSAPCS
jgi:hypothetical protein